jgi:hypothetical protein
VTAIEAAYIDAARACVLCGKPKRVKRGLARAGQEYSLKGIFNNIAQKRYSVGLYYVDQNRVA